MRTKANRDQCPLCKGTCVVNVEGVGVLHCPKCKGSGKRPRVMSEMQIEALFADCFEKEKV